MMRTAGLSDVRFEGAWISRCAWKGLLMIGERRLKFEVFA